MCESTCFGEPILIYKKGGIINLYQVIINKKIDYAFIALEERLFKARINNDGEQEILLSQKDIEQYFLWPTQVSSGNKKQEDSLQPIELMSLTREHLDDLMDLFPKAADSLKDYCVRQLLHLSEVRQKKEHLHLGNYSNHFYRKKQIIIENRAKVDTDMAIEVEELNAEGMRSLIEQKIIEISEQVD